MHQLLSVVPTESISKPLVQSMQIYTWTDRPRSHERISTNVHVQKGYSINY